MVFAADTPTAARSTSPLVLRLAYRTRRGVMLEGLLEQFLKSPHSARLRGRVNLIFTSPPFPLNRKKKYGNLQGQRYIDWLAAFAGPFRDLLAPDGSIVMEMGNAWEQGSPIMSTLALRALLEFMDAGHFKLCQQFVCHNPTRLPGPAQWVNIERIRLKDAFTHVWWMSATERPKVNTLAVLTEYSSAMQKLLKRQTYNAGKRPSEHKIGATSFLKDNGGAIPSNVLTITNTQSNGRYLKYAREHQLGLHPARMPEALPEFFIRLLTDENDLVLDPFAGSNTTGASAETLKRRWRAVEPDRGYIDGSRGRFDLASIRTAETTR